MPACPADGADAVGDQGPGHAGGRRGSQRRELDTTDGVRVIEPDGEWAMVLPDPLEAVTHLWAEAGTPTGTDGCSTLGRSVRGGASRSR